MVLDVTCTSCGNAEGQQPAGLCPACAVAVRLEAWNGLRKLAAYLANWAAFERWLAEHGRV
jgi:hypothetical protein